MAGSLLLLEDDPAIARVVTLALQREGFLVRDYRLIRDAVRELPLHAFQLLILDVGLPDGSGLSWLQSLRAGSLGAAYQTLPAMMLTAQGEEIDKVLGLEVGADDYLTKPFSPRELVARVKALLRRSLATNAAANTAWAQAESHTSLLDLDASVQRIRYANQTLDLTRFEYGVLSRLILANGGILGREALLDAVWGNASDSADRTVDTHIKTLRQKLRAAGADEALIQTHRGMGYSLRHSLNLGARSA